MTIRKKGNPGALALQSGGLTSTSPRSGHIVTRMIDGALDIVRRKGTLVPHLFRVGDFELCEPDYRQVSRWAKELRRSPARMLEELSQQGGVLSPDHFEISGGRIKKLRWDGKEFPIRCFEWEPGLEIDTLRIWNRMPAWGEQAVLPSLQELFVDSAEELCVALSQTPNLRRLDLNGNSLSVIDLSGASQLTRLGLRKNWLTHLDLPPLPQLRELDCTKNYSLSKLDLSPVPQLRRLECSMIKELKELDLSPVPLLEFIDCLSTPIAELDLRPLENPNIEVWHNGNTRVIRE